MFPLARKLHEGLDFGLLPPSCLVYSRCSANICFIKKITESAMNCAVIFPISLRLGVKTCPSSQPAGDEAGARSLTTEPKPLSSQLTSLQPNPTLRPGCQRDLLQESIHTFVVKALITHMPVISSPL